MGSVIPPVLPMSRWRRDGAVVADVRWYLDGRSGRAAYDAGHLPGAVFVDLDRDLAGPSGPAVGRHPLPEPGHFAHSMGRLGIGDGDTVLAYDDAGGTVAARLVWMLRVTGHEAALLDGGIAAYDGALEQARRERPVAVFAPVPWPAERLAVLADATDRDSLVLDARARERYRGEQEPVDPRAGHIPGAVNLPCAENLDAAGCLLPVAELRRRLVAAGVDDDRRVVSSCGSGVTACHTLLAMELAGFAPGRLYAGSWSQYSSDPERPAAAGGGPG